MSFSHTVLTFGVRKGLYGLCDLAGDIDARGQLFCSLTVGGGVRLARINFLYKDGNPPNSAGYDLITRK